ncbi:MAG TPA: GDSL-type esterase/lipase family protein [Candidatus Nanoarchaeia archaeon]
MTKILVGLFLILLVGFAVWFFFRRSEPVEKVTKEGPIIFFGNSLTAGSGAGEGEDFPSLVAKELKMTSVINAGISGDTTQTALNRLKTDVLDKSPSLVVVELSGNDFLQGIDPETTINNLDLTAKQISQTGSKIALVHIHFLRNANEYKAGFEKISEKYNAPVAWSVLAGIVGNPSLMADNIHPNAAGYKIMAQRIAKVLKPLLQ